MTTAIFRIGILLTENNTVDVGAPMQDKQLCYEMLRAAQAVIDKTQDNLFNQKSKAIVIQMDYNGVIDVSAPLPPRSLCPVMLNTAKEVIERYNDDKAPEMRAFSDVLAGV